ncbi:MAG: RluA family pseudouridine synthase [Butyrivibrio sp.]|uniref:RluA family pseudouridine synthase n=1 Tax=Butyrivibrio sp. TaxID=28121 RepID=UPI0025CFF154|nr:RluA family pseudouridine synthase [Butyrivibrio sp.]MCR5770049.1 RluA family pseudouridine synthase [Butyrivibrio sp.]
MKEIVIKDNESGKRFDKFLGQYLSKASSGFIYKMLRKKNITLNGKKATGQEKLQKGDIVVLWFSDDTFLKFANERLASAERGEGVNVSEFKKAYHNIKGVSVIYENKDVLFVNKPVGVLTQKAEQGDVSLNEWIVGYLLEMGVIDPESLITFRPSVSNRLDRNTSGIVICAKTLKGAQMMAKGLKERTFKKYYRTVVKGIIDKPEEITGYLTKDRKSNTVSVSQVKSDSSYIETAYSPVGINEKWQLTYLEVELRTGKTHQIRAHLASIGHPIIGDPKYGDEKINDTYKQTYGLKGQLLHCYRLEFPDDSEAFGDLSGKEIIAPLFSKFGNLIKDKFED